MLREHHTFKLREILVDHFEFFAAPEIFIFLLLFFSTMMSTGFFFHYQRLSLCLQLYSDSNFLCVHVPKLPLLYHLFMIFVISIFIVIFGFSTPLSISRVILLLTNADLNRNCPRKACETVFLGIMY